MSYDPLWPDDFERPADDWHADLIAAQQKCGPCEHAGMDWSGLISSGGLRLLAIDIADAIVDEGGRCAVIQGEPSLASLAHASGSYGTQARRILRELGYRLRIYGARDDEAPCLSLHLMSEQE